MFIKFALYQTKKRRKAMHKYFVWKFRNARYWLYAIVHWFYDKGKVHGRTLGLRVSAHAQAC